MWDVAPDESTPALSVAKGRITRPTPRLIYHSSFIILPSAFHPLSLSLMACAVTDGTNTATPMETPTPAQTPGYTVTLTTPTATPTFALTPTETPESECMSTPRPTGTPILPGFTIFFGGSWGQNRMEEFGPNTAEQTNVWHHAADKPIQYPGDKQEHAKSVNISTYSNTNLVVIGYSAGADSALIFAYAYWEEQQKQGFSGRITGLALLGGTMTGSLINGGRLDNGNWESIFNILIAWGTDIYVLNDSTRSSSVVKNYKAPLLETSGRFWYDDRPKQEHWAGPLKDEINYLNKGTNNSPSYRDEVLMWLEGN